MNLDLNARQVVSLEQHVVFEISVAPLERWFGVRILGRFVFHANLFRVFILRCIPKIKSKKLNRVSYRLWHMTSLFNEGVKNRI